jgi:hypothetical protein
MPRARSPHTVVHLRPPFGPSANGVYWLAIAAIAGALVIVPVALIAWARSPYATGANEVLDQPVKFDHRHHVRDNGIDCLYCHSGADRSRYAGVPATSVCMGCHDQIWTDSPELAPVRRSAFEGAPIAWARVSRLPDFVFFDHSSHVNKGVGCVSCHGRVDRMAQVYAAAPFTMRWCLDCHRDPEPRLRPRDEVTNMEWVPGAGAADVEDVHPRTDCSGCHR